MSIKLNRKVIMQIEKIQKKYIEEFRKYLFTFSNLFSDFEKLNFLNYEGLNFLMKIEFSRNNYKYIQITDYILFDTEKKNFTYRNRQICTNPEDFLSLLYCDFDPEKALKTLKDRVIASNFIIEKKSLSTFLDYVINVKYIFHMKILINL